MNFKNVLNLVLYEDVELIRAEKAKNPEDYFKEKYCSDVFVRAAVKALVKLAGKEAMGVLSATGDLITMMIDMAGVPKLSTITKATYLMEYTACARGKVDELRTDLQDNYFTYSDEELQEKIDEYELAYRIYLSVMQIMIHTYTTK